MRHFTLISVWLVGKLTNMNNANILRVQHPAKIYIKQFSATPSCQRNSAQRQKKKIYTVYAVTIPRSTVYFIINRTILQCRDLNRGIARELRVMVSTTLSKSSFLYGGKYYCLQLFYILLFSLNLKLKQSPSSIQVMFLVESSVLSSLTSITE